MKCKYCNTDIEQDAQFCTNCGKDLSKFKKCISCSELLDRGAEFCPFCGTKQTSDEQSQSKDEPLQLEEKNGSKKWLWGVVGLFLIGLVGGGYYYLSQNRDSSSQLAEAVDTDSIEVDEPVGMADEISNMESVDSNSDGYERLLSEKKLSYSDLENMSKKELEIMRNSIYARYGYRFKRDDLFDYFSHFSWYNPTTSDMTTIYNSMSEIERYNVEFIKKYE